MNSPKIKKIAILGSSGSIGINSLDVIERHPNKFYPLYMSAHRNASRLIQQAKKYKPKGVVITDKAYFSRVKNSLQNICKVYAGLEGISEIVKDPEIDLVLNSMVGSVGVVPTFSAIMAKKDVALANKETLVMAGQLITGEARKKNVHIYPIDSEHSAIWQCLLGENQKNIRKIILTASGGPFRTYKKKDLKNVTVEQALHHPNWEMGAKITIDSATLMNKGLEIIEAFWLYQLAINQIEVVIHPQSVVHSMVEFIDGSIKAQLGVPDMRIPIQFALSYPERFLLTRKNLFLSDLKNLTFEKPDFKKFPCPQIAIDALSEGGTTPIAMNVANEVAVEKFLTKKISFVDIPKLIEKTIEAHPFSKEYNLKEMLELEKWAREYAETCI
jgi:1-deoxy-D-xylulose-5-phosphate reductoisomerase